jgi:hypothetical protein
VNLRFILILLAALAVAMGLLYSISRAGSVRRKAEEDDDTVE